MTEELITEEEALGLLDHLMERVVRAIAKMSDEYKLSIEDAFNIYKREFRLQGVRKNIMDYLYKYKYKETRPFTYKSLIYSIEIRKEKIINSAINRKSIISAKRKSKRKRGKKKIKKDSYDALRSFLRRKGFRTLSIGIKTRGKYQYFDNNSYDRIKRFQRNDLFIDIFFNFNGHYEWVIGKIDYKYKDPYFIEIKGTSLLRLKEILSKKYEVKDSDPLKKGFSIYLKKAKEEYLKTGEMNSKRACILLACIPTRDLVREKGEELKLSNKVIDYAIEIIKKYEKKYGIGKMTNIRRIASSSLYVSSILNDQSISQRELANLFGITPMTVRNGIKDLHKFLKIKIIKRAKKFITFKTVNTRYDALRSLLRRKGFEISDIGIITKYNRVKYLYSNKKSYDWIKRFKKNDLFIDIFFKFNGHYEWVIGKIDWKYKNPYFIEIKGSSLLKLKEILSKQYEVKD